MDHAAHAAALADFARGRTLSEALTELDRRAPGIGTLDRMMVLRLAFPDATFSACHRAAAEWPVPRPERFRLDAVFASWMPQIDDGPWTRCPPPWTAGAAHPLDLPDALRALLHADTPADAHAQAVIADHLESQGDSRGAAIRGLTWASGLSADEVGLRAHVRIGSAEAVLRWVPGGHFERGSPDLRGARPHTVTLTRGFWMAETRVSTALWTTVLVMSGEPIDAWPHANITWTNARRWLNRLDPWVPGATLPTEAEWACAALNAPELGVLDQADGTSEWCVDRFGPYRGDAVDPVGPVRGDRRVLRGGRAGQVAYRNSWFVDAYVQPVGLRWVVH